VKNIIKPNKSLKNRPAKVGFIFGFCVFGEIMLDLYFGGLKPPVI